MTCMKLDKLEKMQEWKVGGAATRVLAGACQ